MFLNIVYHELSIYGQEIWHCHQATSVRVISINLMLGIWSIGFKRIQNSWNFGLERMCHNISLCAFCIIYLSWMVISMRENITSLSGLVLVAYFLRLLGPRWPSGLKHARTDHNYSHRWLSSTTRDRSLCEKGCQFVWPRSFLRALRIPPLFPKQTASI